jgi:hypothetical protein
VNPVSKAQPRINPQHRTIDLPRLAAALLDLAALLDIDEDEIRLGSEIFAKFTTPKEKSA